MPRHVGRGPAPGRLPGGPRAACADGILLHVSCRRQQVGFIPGKGGDASLPGKAAPALPAVDPPGIPPMGFPDGATEVGRRGRSGDHMEMVRQQAVRPDFPLPVPTPLAHQGNVCLIVLGTETCLWPPIPPLGDVVRDPRRDHPRDACQIDSLFVSGRFIKNSVWCPRNSRGILGASLRVSRVP